MELLDHMKALYAFNSLKSCQTVFKGSCTILHSPPAAYLVPVSPHSHSVLSLICPLACSPFRRMQLYLNEDLSCMSLTANEVDHLFRYSLATRGASLKKLYSDPSFAYPLGCEIYFAFR